MAANDTDRLRVLIIDGDGATRMRLRTLLQAIESPVSLDDAASAPQAERKIGEMQPDLVLLDLDMAGAVGIRALDAVETPHCIAVMTAHPELALPALELEAVDYLAKPVTRERLELCLRRTRRRIAERRIAELALEIAGAAAAIHGIAPAAPRAVATHYPDQMTIRVRRRMFALPVCDITWIEGASQYSRVHAKSGEYLLSRSLASLESELDPMRFFRIHRSAIVNATYVREVMSRGDGRYNICLHGGQALPMGRSRREMLKHLVQGIGRTASGAA